MFNKQQIILPRYAFLQSMKLTEQLFDEDVPQSQGIPQTVIGFREHLIQPVQEPHPVDMGVDLFLCFCL